MEERAFAEHLRLLEVHPLLVALNHLFEVFPVDGSYDGVVALGLGH